MLLNVIPVGILNIQLQMKSRINDISAFHLSTPSWKSLLIGIGFIWTTATIIFPLETSARPKWTRADSRECRTEFKKSYIESSGGISPPKGMENDYCDCAEVAYKTGDTLSTLTSFCSEAIQKKYYQ